MQDALYQQNKRTKDLQCYRPPPWPARVLIRHDSRHPRNPRGDFHRNPPGRWKQWNRLI